MKTIYRLNDKIILREEENNTYLCYNVLTKDLYAINNIGHTIIDKACNSKNIESVIEEVCKELNENIVESQNDIREYISSLVESGILVENKNE